jgi:hypothetical protein
MFLTLLVVTLVVAFATALTVARAFARPIDNILRRIIADEIGVAWQKYMQFAILVVGVSAGVRISELERYVTPPQWVENPNIIELTRDRWILELYRTVIETLQGIAWTLLVFFVFALVAYVIVRIAEMRRGSAEGAKQQ